VVDGLKVLDPKRPIREADICQRIEHVCFVPTANNHQHSHQDFDLGQLVAI
jgi:hypothetical protein